MDWAQLCISSSTLIAHYLTLTRTIEIILGRYEAHAAIPLWKTSSGLGVMLERDSSHDTTSGTTARITSLERVSMTALAEIILASVNDNASTDNRVRAEEREMLV